MNTFTLYTDGTVRELSSLSVEMHSSNPERRTAVIILERDGSLLNDNPSDQRIKGTKASVAIPAELVNHPEPSTLIDRILDFTFNMLGLHRIELRVYEDCCS